MLTFIKDENPPVKQSDIEFSRTPESLEVVKSSKKKRGKAPKPPKEYFSDKKMPVYNGLSRITSQDVEEIAEQIGWNFVAAKVPAYYKVEGKEVMVPDQMSVIRRDTSRYLGMVGVGRPLYQYLGTLEFMQMFCQQGTQFEKGGTAGYGRTAYLVMKMAECFKLSPEDQEITCNFCVQTSHDSSRSLVIMPTPMRNGLVFIHPNFKTGIRIKHTKKMDARLIVMQKSIHKIKQYFQEFEDSFRRLAKIKLANGVEEQYMKLLFPFSEDEESKVVQRKRDKVKEILDTDVSLRTPPTHQTLLGMYFAAVTFYDQYLRTNKMQGRDDSTAHIESKIDMDGSSVKRKADALAFALKLNARFGSEKNILSNL